MQGVLTLKNTYFEPRYVLIMPLNNEAHEKRLQERGVYSESQINWTLNRAEMYAEYNRIHPGLFDMMINSGKYPLSPTIVPQDITLQLLRLSLVIIG